MYLDLLLRKDYDLSTSRLSNNPPLRERQRQTETDTDRDKTQRDTDGERGTASERVGKWVFRILIMTGTCVLRGGGGWGRST